MMPVVFVGTSLKASLIFSPAGQNITLLALYAYCNVYVPTYLDDKNTACIWTRILLLIYSIDVTLINYLDKNIASNILYSIDVT